MKRQSKAERISDREIVVTRIINGPTHLVYEAWTNAEIFKRWWIPEGAPMTLLSCHLDVRLGGGYRLKIAFGEQQMEFFGKYTEVIPNAKIVWTNEEGGDVVITTVTFKETKGTTLVTVHDLYPSKAALDEAISNGSTSGMPTQLDQLDQFIFKGNL